MTKALFPTMDEMRKVVRSLQPGEAMLYHVGELAVDRMRDPLVDDIANYALLLGTGAGVKVRVDYPGVPPAPLGMGFGHLFQKRVPRGDGTAFVEYYLRRKPQ